MDTRPIYTSPDDPQAQSSRRKPQVPLQPVITADFSLIRFISHPQRKYNQSWLQEWVAHLDTWLQQGKQIYFFVHCPQEEYSPETARYFQSLLEQKGIEIPALPWRSVATQMSLF